MPLWQLALLVLIGAWTLQALGTYRQMTHYRAVMGEISGTWSDGFVGAGNARSTFGAGVILLLVVGPDREVRRLMVMRGRSVFARFNRVASAEGRALDALKTSPPFEDKARAGALALALQQIEKAALRSAAS